MVVTFLLDSRQRLWDKRAMNKQDEADAEQREGMWKAIVCVALFWAAAVALIVLVTGCSYSVHPDGTETFTADPDAFLKAIEILGEK